MRIKCRMTSHILHFHFRLLGSCAGARSAHEPYSRTHRLCIKIHPQTSPEYKRAPSLNLHGLTNSPTQSNQRGVGLEPTACSMGWGKVCLLCQLWESNPPSPARTLVLSPVHATDRVGSSQPLIPASALPRVRDLLLVVGVPCFPHPVTIVYYKMGQMSIPF